MASVRYNIFDKAEQAHALAADFQAAATRFGGRIVDTSDGEPSSPAHKSRGLHSVSFGVELDDDKIFAFLAASMEALKAHMERSRLSVEVKGRPHQWNFSILADG